MGSSVKLDTGTVTAKTPEAAAEAAEEIAAFDAGFRKHFRCDAFCVHSPTWDQGKGKTLASSSSIAEMLVVAATAAEVNYDDVVVVAAMREGAMVEVLIAFGAPVLLAAIWCKDNGGSPALTTSITKSVAANTLRALALRSIPSTATEH